MKKLLLTLALALPVVIDTSSATRVILRERYGPAIEVDSVTLAIEHEGNIYITRNKRAYGIFPLSNYSLIIKERI